MPFPLNRVELIGRLGRDAELRYTPDAVAVATFNLATDRPKLAAPQPETDWHRVVAWRKLGEFAGEYLTKGRLVFVAGRLTYRDFEGRDGQQRRAAEIVATEIILLDRRPEAAVPEPSTASDDEVPF